MAERITDGNAGKVARDFQRIFGANKNLYRITPKLQSGNRPGKDRILWSLWLDSGRPQNTKPETISKLKDIKVQIIASDTVKFHPHGETANGEVTVTNGQRWNNNCLCVKGRGFYGSPRGDKHAAFRYISGYLSEYAIDCFFDDFDSYSVPMKLNFDETAYEPEYLPSKYPNILVNPAMSGIGYGLASNIPGFNFTELMNATISLIKNSDAKILLIPDSPTGADIIDTGHFKEINRTGEGKMTLQASSSIDYSKNIITITSVPLQTTTQGMIDKILELKSRKMFKEIIDIKDYSQKDDVHLELYVAPDENPDKVLEELYKRATDMRKTYAIGITFVDDFKPFTMGVKDTLLRWIDYRRDEVTSMFQNKLQKHEHRVHISDAIIDIYEKNYADEVFKIAKNSIDRDDNIRRLMSKFGFTSVQASAIVDFKISQFNKKAVDKVKEERKQLLEELKTIEEYLSDDEKIDEFIIGQLKDGIKKYGRPRMSKVVRADDVESPIPNTNHLVAISESGYIKKMSTKNKSVGPCGPDNGNLTVIQANNRDDILVVDSSGYLCRISISAINNMEYEDRGVPLNRFFNVSGHVVSVMQCPKNVDLKESPLCMILTTKFGLSKRIMIKEFSKQTTICMGLNDGDEVVSALFTRDDSIKDVCIFTNLGYGVRRPISDIKIVGKSAKGTKQINLRSGEYVVGMSKIDTNKKYIFYATSSGNCKVTELKYFPQMDRNAESVQLIILGKNESLVGLSSVKKNDSVMLFRKQSDPVTIDVSDIEVGVRMAKGKKCVSTPKGDFVCAFKVFNQ